MTVAAQTIIKQVQLELQDPTGVRWPATDLVTILHAGQLAILTKRPDQNAVTATLVPVAGARQTLQRQPWPSSTSIATPPGASAP